MIQTALLCRRRKENESSDNRETVVGILADGSGPGLQPGMGGEPVGRCRLGTATDEVGDARLLQQPGGGEATNQTAEQRPMQASPTGNRVADGAGGSLLFRGERWRGRTCGFMATQSVSQFGKRMTGNLPTGAIQCRQCGILKPDSIGHAHNQTIAQGQVMGNADA
ncbi:MAG TPA: hypothetical protein PKM88_15040 [bacterium]|nr:hypothetical protein [bacterium]